MVSAEQRLTKQVNMIQSGFCGHTTDIMEVIRDTESNRNRWAFDGLFRMIF